MAEAALAAVLGGFVFVVFYLAGGMGAGDVKLVAATASLVGMSSLPVLLVSTGVAGALFALALSAGRGVLRETVVNTWIVLGHHRSNGLRQHPQLNLRNPSTTRLPYAVPVAAGCVAALLKAVAHQ
jgi:prepilin peptidase CpaA